MNKIEYNKLNAALIDVLEKFNAAFAGSKLNAVNTGTRDEHALELVAVIAECRGRFDLAVEIRNLNYLIHPPGDEDISAVVKIPVDCLSSATGGVGGGK